MLTLESKIEEAKLFQPEEDDRNTSVLNAKNTNLINLSNIKYQWADKLYKLMRSNFWTPEIVNLAKDDLSVLTPEERKAMDDILGFLVFLDSEQTANLPHIAKWITNPEIRVCLTEQASQEALHSVSYQTIFTTLYTQRDADEVYYRFKSNKLLHKRAEYVTNIYQKMIDDPSLKNFINVLVMNILLEGLYFYVGFNFFYNLTYNGKLEGVSSIIRLINIDEKSHIGIFSGIINAIKAESGDELRKYIDDTILTMSKEAYDIELEWSLDVTEELDDFIPIDVEEFLKHTLQVNVLNKLNLTLFEKTNNPYKHLTKIANVDKGTDVKGNFFESNSNSYNQASALEGFGDF